MSEPGRGFSSVLLGVVAGCLAACGGSTGNGSSDAGAGDGAAADHASRADASGSDEGTTQHDSGGAAPDTGPPDGSTDHAAPDSAAPDSGAHDGGSTGDGGSGHVTLATGQGEPAFIAVDGTSIYWTTFVDCSIAKVPLGGGTPMTLATTGGGYPEGIAVDHEPSGEV
jgi:hypothetical protein